MPSGPFDAIQGPVRQLHEMRSWPGTAHTYTPADSDGEWWEDGGGTTGDGWNETDQPVDIAVDFGTAPSVVRGPGGREITGDAAVTVDPSDHPGGEAAFQNGGGDGNRATEITDGDSGTRYRVLRVEDDHSGVLILDCEELV